MEKYESDQASEIVRLGKAIKKIDDRLLVMQEEQQRLLQQRDSYEDELFQLVNYSPTNEER